MDVQIGDVVLFFDVYGTASAAIVTSIGDNLTIGCTCFMDDGTLRPMKWVLHKRAVMQGFPCSFWDFRPSQKETPPVFSFQHTNDGANWTTTDNSFREYPGKGCLTAKQLSKFHDWSKRFQPDSVEIKPRPYFEDKPALGTFEWALVALKNGQSVRRSCWYEAALAVKINGTSLRFLNDGSVYAPHPRDLLATDWVLA